MTIAGYSPSSLTSRPADPTRSHRRRIWGPVRSCWIVSATPALRARCDRREGSGYGSRCPVVLSSPVARTPAGRGHDGGDDRGDVEVHGALSGRLREPVASCRGDPERVTEPMGGLVHQVEILESVAQLEGRRVGVRLDVPALDADYRADRCVGQYIEGDRSIKSKFVSESESFTKCGDGYTEDQVRDELGAREDREPTCGRLRNTAPDWGIDQGDVLGQSLTDRADGVGSDGGHVDQYLPGTKRAGHAVVGEQDLLERERIREHGDHDVRAGHGAGSLLLVIRALADYPLFPASASLPDRYS